MYDMDLDTSMAGSSLSADGYQQAEDLSILGSCIKVGIGGLLGGFGGGILCDLTNADQYLGRAFDTAPENVEYAFEGIGTAAGVGVAGYQIYKEYKG